MPRVLGSKKRHIDGFGVRLAIIRENRGLTQVTIAQRIGIAYSSYACWEWGKGSPSLPHLLELTRILEVSADYLLSGETE